MLPLSGVSGLSDTEGILFSVSGVSGSFLFGFSVTVTLHTTVSLLPNFTWIVALQALCAVTTPLSFTVATEGSLLTNVAFPRSSGVREVFRRNTA